MIILSGIFRKSIDDLSIYRGETLDIYLEDIY